MTPDHGHGWAQDLPVLKTCDADAKKYCQQQLTSYDDKHIKSVDIPVGEVSSP